MINKALLTSGSRNNHISIERNLGDLSFTTSVSNLTRVGHTKVVNIRGGFSVTIDSSLTSIATEQQELARSIVEMFSRDLALRAEVKIKNAKEGAEET